MFCQYRLFHRTFRLYRQYKKKPTTFTFKQLTKQTILKGVQICCIATKAMDKKLETVNLEEDITTALQEGETSIIELMNQLKDFVIVISKEYRNCLLKQIEIIQKASDVGPLSESWDDLPQYRTLATELLNELTEYCTMFNVLESLARNNSTFSKSNTDIFGKFVEIQKYIQKEVDHNKRIEKELLKIVTDSIVHEVMDDEA